MASPLDSIVKGAEEATVVMPSDSPPTAEPVEQPEKGAELPEGVGQSEELVDETSMQFSCFLHIT